MKPSIFGDLAFRAIFLFQFRTYFYLMVLIFFNNYCCFLTACMTLFSINLHIFFVSSRLATPTPFTVSLTRSYTMWTWYSLELACFEISSPKCICALFWSRTLQVFGKGKVPVDCLWEYHMRWRRPSNWWVFVPLWNFRSFISIVCSFWLCHFANAHIQVYFQGFGDFQTFQHAPSKLGPKVYKTQSLVFHSSSITSWYHFCICNFSHGFEMY